MTLELVTTAICSTAAGAGISWLWIKRSIQSKIKSNASNDRLKRQGEHKTQAWESLLDSIDDAILIIDGSSQIRFSNGAARKIFGAREAQDRPVAEVLLDPRLSEGILESLRTGEATLRQVVLAQQGSPRGDQENRGTNAWVVDTAIIPNTPPDERLARVILRDITATFQTEQVRKDFVANASHELRTPLAIIRGYLENLLEEDGIEDPEMARRFLSIMQKHTDRISRIIEDMLMISRLESGEAGRLKIEPFSMHSCAHDVLERLESVIRNQHAEAVINLPDDGITIEGDRFYWTQVLFNLVENALKQNPNIPLRVEIGGRKLDSGKLQIWVADNGIGIPSADLPYIFRRFYRVEKHHSQREIKGTGLGLSIVKRAIEAHGGTIHVTSTPGVDTRFSIEV